MVSVAFKKNWYQGLPNLKDQLQDQKMEKNPDQPNIDAANELGQYLLERGKLEPSAKTKRMAQRRGKGGGRGAEDMMSWVEKGVNVKKPTTNRERMLTLYQESLQGRWPQSPSSEDLERKLFQSNQNYKKPLPYDY
jgi:hypothetical protein